MHMHDAGLTFKVLKNRVCAALGLSENDTAIEARLKNFKRVGFASHTATGRGIQATYKEEDVDNFKLALAMNLAGLSPAKAIEIVEEVKAHGEFTQVFGDVRVALLVEQERG